MSVELAASLRRGLRSWNSVILQLAVDDADAERAAVAVRSAAARIRELTGTDDAVGRPKAVFPVAPVPGGPLLFIDTADTPVRDLKLIPELVVAALEEAQVRDATVRPAPRLRRGWDEVAEWKGLAVANLCPPVADPPGVPSWLTRLAARWALQVGPSSADPSLFVAGAELPLSSRDGAAALLADAASCNYGVALSVTDFTTAMATGAVDGCIAGHTPLATLRASTRAADPDDLAALMHRARSAVAGVAAEVAWAGVSTEAYSSVPMAVSISGGFWFPAAADRFVLDACWWQLLGPGHIEVLGGVPADAEQRPDGGVELTVGTAAQWHPDHPDHDRVRAAAHKILRRCLDEEAAMQYGEKQLRAAYPSIYR